MKSVRWSLRFVSIVALVSGLLLPASTVRADVVLTFNIAGIGGFDPIPQAYGDRVTSLTQGSFSYGGDGVFTPNVVVAYGPGATDVQFWPTSYGDLSNVAFTNNTPGILEIRLTADPGFLVNLHSFDLAGWPTTDYTIRSLQVLGDGALALFSQSNVPVEGDFVGPRHSSFDFSGPLQGESLTIRFDAGNLGFSSDNIGIDNIRFSQQAQAPNVIPEPTGLALAALGALGLFVYTRRARRRG